MVCVRKKDGSMRLCIDYRELNQKNAGRMPILRIQDVLENLVGHKYFSKLVMFKAYHQGFVHKNSQHLTAFTSPWGFYEWLKISFGLSTAVSASQRFMSECLSGLRDSICIPYLDDILCYGKTFDKHLENLRTVFCRLRQIGVKLKAEKFIFLTQK